jgi:hypothetical protein
MCRTNQSQFLKTGIGLLLFLLEKMIVPEPEGNEVD